MDDAAVNLSQPFLISAVIPTYNVARYLPEFLRSLETQTIGIEAIELVFVNDGSLDESPAIIRRWAAGRPNVVIIDQENAGLSEARNAGVRAVRGEWVTFTDPDDTVDAGYFAEVTKFLRLHDRPELSLVATHQMIHDEATGLITNSHPLRGKFERGSRMVDLDIDPMIQLSANSSFTRVALIRELGLTFDPKVRPQYEDAHFITRYLLESRTHHLGLVASAKYHYRTRSDGSSLVQSSWARPEKYTDLIRYGYLDLLQRADALGPIPRWTQNIVLYDLLWFFKNERAIHSPTSAAPPEVFDEFHSLMREVFALIDTDTIVAYDIARMEFVVKQAILTAYKEDGLRPRYAKYIEVDESRQEVHLSYWFSGDLPVERVQLDGHVANPLYSTVEECWFFGRVLLKQRHLWVKRAFATRLEADGVGLQMVSNDQLGHSTILTSRQLDPLIMSQRRVVRQRWQTPQTSMKSFLTETRNRWKSNARKNLSGPARFDAALATFLHTRKNRDKYRDAWAFMDKNTDANDNAEHLYRYVSQTHPEINSWFVLDRSSRDWDRLEGEGFRLVAYRSFDWYMLMLNAIQMASSHIDHYVVRPLEPKRYGWPRFKFTFLQHGIINYDLSRWLNIKPISLLVTSTWQERDSIANDGPYVFSDRETIVTGLPRHDELLRKRNALSDEERDLILIMPTWREALLGSRVEGSNERERGRNFLASDWAQQYSELLRSPRILSLAKRTGKRVAFMPHPNMRPHLHDFDLPGDVLIFDFAKDNVQDVLARTAAMVTDYSSLGFEAAFLDIPLIYFQFDSDTFFNGSHMGRRGYFDYERDGFGPVACDVDTVLDRLEVLRDDAFAQPEQYAERTASTFVTRDEHNSERVFRAMLALLGGKRLTEPARPSISVTTPDLPSGDHDRLT